MSTSNDTSKLYIKYNIIHLVSHTKCQNEKKTKFSLPKNNSLITGFFPKEANNSIQVPKEKQKSHIDQFYAVQQKECQEKTCADKKVELQKQLIASKSKLVQTEKAYAVAMEICTEKDAEILALQCKIDSINTVATVDTDDSSLNEVPFSKFATDFEEEHLNAIRSVGISVREDSTFVLQVIRSLYANNLQKLQSVSITGRSKDKSKEQISPKKMNILSSMYKERLSKLPEREIRLHNLNQLIARGIINITKAIKKKNCREEMMSKINETFKENEK